MVVSCGARVARLLHPGGREFFPMKDYEGLGATLEGVSELGALHFAQNVREERQFSQELRTSCADRSSSVLVKRRARRPSLRKDSLARGAGSGAMRTPREHGFWVMLTVALLLGVTLGGSAASLGLAALAFGALLAGAAVVGRRIRKNVPLQVGAALLLGASVFPLARAGSCGVSESLLASGTLALVFSSTTMSVQEILLRARKRLWAARLSGGLAVFTTAAALAAALFFHSRAATLAFSLTLALQLAFAFWPPSPKRLRFVGMAIACVQLLVAGVLMTLELAPSSARSSQDGEVS